MKKVIYFLSFLLLCTFSTIALDGCAKQSTLNVVLEDLYYEEFYVWAGQTFDILVAKLAIENEGNGGVDIINTYVIDGSRLYYDGMLLYEKWTKTACLCNTGDINYQKIERIQSGENASGYFMAFKAVPKDVNDLKLVIVTETGQVSISLGEASSIRRIELPNDQ
ncbi:MAG: hypothetical protein KAV87_22790 [Desulfobacteraceae bacterium]|nr:hypothetical protein [Desulfobacteraceae bacterium]